MFDFTGKVILVTGSSRGIGRDIAESFYQAGASVALCSRKKLDIDELITQLSGEKNNTRLAGFRADMGDLESIKCLINSVLNRFGRIDILVNNAGVQFPKPSLEVNGKDWDTTIDINLKGYFFASKLAVSDMIKKGIQGNIVNIGSVNGVTVVVGQAVYASSKAAISQMTKSLAREWGGYGIRVNCIAPGSIPTSINAAIYADPEVERSMSTKIPLKRRGRTDEVSNAVLFIASDYASYITGQTLYVDGGLTLVHG